MALTYDYIIRQAALRVNAITGAIASTLETNYTAAPVTAYQSTIFPKTSIYDAVRIAEGKLATTIAFSGNDSFRAAISSATSALASGAAMPVTDANGVKIIGQYGDVLDGVDPTIVCSAASPQEIRRRLNTSSYWVVPAYLYSYVGRNIIHTRTTVIVQVCVYDGSARATAIAANGNVLLADSLEEAYVNGTVSELLRDDEFASQSQIYRGYFERTLAEIRGGYSNTSQVSMPGPVLSQASQ
jgi:hypothetical protein